MIHLGVVGVVLKVVNVYSRLSVQVRWCSFVSCLVKSIDLFSGVSNHCRFCVVDFRGWFQVCYMIIIMNIISLFQSMCSTLSTLTWTSLPGRNYPVWFVHVLKPDVLQLVYLLSSLVDLPCRKCCCLLTFIPKHHREFQDKCCCFFQNNNIHGFLVIVFFFNDSFNSTTTPGGWFSKS